MVGREMEERDNCQRQVYSALGMQWFRRGTEGRRDGGTEGRRDGGTEKTKASMVDTCPLFAAK
jgi:hypothetical protein